MGSSQPKRSRIWAIPRDEFISIIEQSASLSDAVRTLGLRPVGGNHRTVKERSLAEGISLTRLLEGGRLASATKRAAATRRPLKQVLVKDSNYSRFSLKQRLLREGILRNRCEMCGLGSSWNGRPIVLTL